MKNKKHPISFSWPVSIEFEENPKPTENENKDIPVTNCKIKVFYTGETVDHRFFSKDFANKLIRSLPKAPIVGFYDEEKEDFVGHATEQQVLGFVDPTVTPTIEVDAKTSEEWAVCGGVLYTERPDKVGELAKKIKGHPQSLELDASTVQYKINYDEKAHFQNIEFTDGKIIGLSVLGMSQRPAFAGSNFFSSTSSDPSMVEKVNYLLNYLAEKEKRLKDEQGGSKQMNLAEFVKLSWDERGSRIDAALNKEYGEEAITLPIDFFDDCFVARFYYFQSGEKKLFRIGYSIDEEGNVNFTTNPIEVVPTYTPLGVVEETNNTFEGQEGGTPATGNTNDGEPEGDTSAAEGGKSNVSETTAEEENNTFNANDGDGQGAEGANNPSTNEGDTPTVEGSTNNDTGNDEGGSKNTFMEEKDLSGTSSLSPSEREELESLRRKEKLNLIDKYKDSLTEEEYNSFTSNVDKFSAVNELKLELLEKYEAHQEAIKAAGDHKSNFSNSFFMLNGMLESTENSNPADSELEAYVSAHLTRK